MSRPMKRLMRSWYKTDVNPEDPEYGGAFSDPFPQNPGWEIVGVDWSTAGWVEVTYLVPAEAGGAP